MPGLKDILETYLNRSCPAILRGDGSESGTCWSRIRGRETGGVIKDIQELRTKLESVSLVDLKVLDQRSVPLIVDVRPDSRE